MFVVTTNNRRKLSELRGKLHKINEVFYIIITPRDRRYRPKRNNPDSLPVETSGRK